jgi:hypothetical protein
MIHHRQRKEILEHTCAIELYRTFNHPMDQSANNFEFLIVLEHEERVEVA